MLVIAPTMINLIIYIIIFNYVRSSSHRVHPSVQNTGNDVNNQQPRRMSRRDNQLIRRMVIMFSFIGGWSPIYIFLIITPDYFFTLVLSSCFIFLAQLCLLFDVINLYVHNSELRKYLQNIIFKCSNTEQ